MRHRHRRSRQEDAAGEATTGCTAAKAAFSADEGMSAADVTASSAYVAATIAVADSTTAP